MSDYDRGFEEGLAEGLGIREVLTSPESPPSVPVAGPDSSSTQTPASDHLGACGHGLDAWESHVEHHPECPVGHHLEARHAYDHACTCPEVCPACCRECP
jgi:hypothetical protein